MFREFSASREMVASGRRRKQRLTDLLAARTELNQPAGAMPVLIAN